MFTRVLRLLIPALCTLTVLHYWWSLGSLSCCGYWSYWDVWWGTCSKCLSCSQFLGVFTEEELAKCTCTLYQEHHGKTPASVLGTWAVHVLSVVLWTVNKNALICEPLSFVLMKSRIETAVRNADESAFQKHILNFFLFCLVQLAGDYTYADFPSDKAKIICFIHWLLFNIKPGWGHLRFSANLGSN